MAAVTGTIVALGGLGLSAAQAIKANKDMKQAGQAAAKAAGELKNIKEFNAFKQVQVPTLGYELAQQSQAQATTQAMQSLQGAGAEGVIGGVGNVLQATGEQNLQLAAQAQQAQSQRDMAQAEAEQGIEARRQERERIIGGSELQGAQEARAAAEQRKNKAVEGMFTSLGGVAEGVGGLIPLYKNNTGGINWNSMSGNNSPSMPSASDLPKQYITGSTITNAQANALQGNKSGQVIFK